MSIDEYVLVFLCMKKLLSTRSYDIVESDEKFSNRVFYYELPCGISSPLNGKNVILVPLGELRISDGYLFFSFC